MEDDEPLPKTLDEAVFLLLSELDEDSKNTIRSTKREDLIQFHHSWGMGIRNDFGLWDRNPQLLNACGEDDPDDASMIIMEAVWDALQSN